MPTSRLIPSVDQLLRGTALTDAIARDGRQRVAESIRRSAAELRSRMRAAGPGLPSTEIEAVQWIQEAALADLEAGRTPSLTRVINATGVILHTNLGRAPLAEPALAQAAGVAGGYTNLEFDLAIGRRGHRHAHAEALLTRLTGAEAALVANNNAAAVLLVLAALAAGREVIVSRGELVEIGGGFRVPDILAQSGAVLREVGTTNRTRVADYAAAIGPRTAAILRVHPSNFTIEGFTERPDLPALADLAHRFELPVVEDLGSGWLGLDDVAAEIAALAGEPSVLASLRAGVDLVMFSGDKLLGGPQAGIVVGRRALVERARTHPLMRAVRADKLTYAALEGTLALWMSPADRGQIPAYRMLTATADAIGARAEAVRAAVAGAPGLSVDVTSGASAVGGGSAPSVDLPTRLLALTLRGVPASELETRLRLGTPPIIARIDDDRVLIDLRTVDPDDDATIVARLVTLAGAGESRS